jgi:hypothetical protein
MGKTRWCGRKLIFAKLKVPDTLIYWNSGLTCKAEKVPKVSFCDVHACEVLMREVQPVYEPGYVMRSVDNLMRGISSPFISKFSSRV